ncbi:MULTISPECIES: DUF2330 domain-containing protein [Okeania]|uniref:DUF2330 domain-containing protein n=1 Tax=Okeania hirsuta TaxID=1458930 RepID=A0A3N6P6W4_9CYAN|nr:MULTISPECIES: DUF2330 domain-containing protein [Okeania]NES92654.1 DUF2330 domain-containing protein [Okeania sp. SIO2B9]NET77686.1 DUF2330 domain-containing protein [Okeania sp. SIO1F9]RQH18880.1 DUF2330 domain-containing protein [Okeania hirsuta]RQH50236.1 DUF2330 domain-containing protein [Okeania hirsuta]
MFLKLRLKKIIKLSIVGSLILVSMSIDVKKVRSFCGFFVAKVDAEMFNNRSQVAIAHQDNQTTYSLAFDYKGEPEEFALILPVPVVLKKQDVKVISPKLFQRLDDFTAPRLVEYHSYKGYDEDGAYRGRYEADIGRYPRQNVRVIESFTAGEYDIVILSATESNSLESWLRENQYKIPRGAAKYLKPYINKKLFFFVVRVNLEAQEKLGFQNLRPLQFTVKNYPQIMLPFQLGKINSEDTLNIVVYFLSKTGRAEVNNYENVVIPSNFDVPLNIESKFGEFYRELLTSTIQATRKEIVVIEYAWDTGFCDPCNTIPLDSQELNELGMNHEQAFITRLHLQYAKNTYNQDLEFTITSDKTLYQGRYVLLPIKYNEGSDDFNDKVKIKNPSGKVISEVELKKIFEKF